MWHIHATSNIYRSCVRVGTNERCHRGGGRAANPEVDHGNSAGHRRDGQLAAAHHRHVHERRHFSKRSGATRCLAPMINVRSMLLLLLLLCQAGKNWMFNNAKTPQHCELMTSHLRNRIAAEGAHFELRLHLIYLTNDVLHHWWAMCK